MARMPNANAEPNATREEKVRPEELPRTERVRQGTTGHGVRYVLTFGLIFVIAAFLIAWLVIRWFEFSGAAT